MKLQIKYLFWKFLKLLASFFHTYSKKGVIGQVKCLFVSIPDLCILPLAPFQRESSDYFTAQKYGVPGQYAW